VTAVHTNLKGNELNKRHALVAAAAVGALATPAAARAHVSLHPNVLPAGDFPTVDIRVPNETDNARTVRVDVKIPPGFTALDPQRVPGWNIKLLKTKLAKPIQTDDGPVTEEVSEVIFTAANGQGTPPGYIENFPIAFSVPGKSGDTLTFKAVQTYSNGQVVRWIGPPSADKPAPTVNVGPKDGSTYDLAGDAGPGAGQIAPAGLTPAAGHAPQGTRTVVQKSGGASKGLAIAALIVGALGLLAGGAALASRRRPAGRTPELSKETA
jgi:periplasmic copper chaperone A